YQLSYFFWPHQLSVLRAGGSRDALVNQRASEIIDACSEKQLRHPRAFLDPRHLNVWYVIVQHYSRDCMHLDHFVAIRARPDVGHHPAAIHRRLGVYKAEWHKFRKAVSLLLDLTQEGKVFCFVARCFDVAVHYGRGGRYPKRMRLLYCRNPVLDRNP